MKKLISFITVFTMLMCSFVFAEASGVNTSGGLGATYITGAQEFLEPGADGPVFSKGKETTGAIINTTNQTTDTPVTTETDDKQTRLAQLQAQLAALRNGGSVSTSTATTYNVEIASGIRADGVAYGLARLAQNLEAKRGQTSFVSATKVGDNRYNVVLKSVDAWANGTFQVDIFGSNENSLKDGYQIWFSIYDANGRKVGTAQAKRI